MAKSQETKAERQARERLAAKEAKRGHGKKQGNGGPTRKPDKQKESREAAWISLHRQINTGYLKARIKTWFFRLTAALAICYGLYFFYTDFTEWAEEKITERYGHASEQQ